jgi:hypothetical protein
MTTHPKPARYQRHCPWLSFREIGEQLGIPESTAYSLFRRGMKKLERKKGAVEGLLSVVHAVATEEHPILTAGSAECDREFRALWGGGR